MNWLKGKKTYIISALMVMTSLIHLVSGDLTLVEFLNGEQIINLFEALGLTTLRAGVWQNQKETTQEILKKIHFPYAG
ncbi:MAG: hypothetical protein H8E42_09225 [Nitrospinae bacterium]|nr:hypothetical protein [Nitrospinota bacterium]MBL7020709.1 hypothetical protein [Nitrospinaceae bacterium]